MKNKQTIGKEKPKKQTNKHRKNNKTNQVFTRFLIFTKIIKKKQDKYYI